MSEAEDALAVALISEILTAEQLLRSRLGREMPKGMELSHFTVLNQLARVGERSPAQLARTLHVTRGAMTNTLAKLEAQGLVLIRPDWDDARRKIVTISPAGHAAWAEALRRIAPVMGRMAGDLGPERIRAALPVLRALRSQLEPPREPETPPDAPPQIGS